MGIHPVIKLQNVPVNVKQEAYVLRVLRVQLNGNVLLDISV
jgi:hypothetical protein